jgi:hypothetical protein
MESMDVMWEKIKKNVKEGAARSIEKMEELTKIGKLKFEEMALQRKIEKNFMDMGERVFSLTEDGKRGTVEEDLAVKKAIENVKSLKIEIVAIAEKIKAVQEEARRNRNNTGDDDPSGV